MKKTFYDWAIIILIILAVLFVYGKYFVAETEIEQLTYTVYVLGYVILAFLIDIKRSLEAKK